MKNKKGLEELLNTAAVKKHDPEDEMANHMSWMARVTKLKYDALIKEGFNKRQALELSKNLLSMEYKS
tara:strand:+ start:575 stop:778 length:204 start_codon:yes stop_codon:yes gene_type:complete